MKALAYALALTLMILGPIAAAQESPPVRMHIASASVAEAINQWAEQTGFRVVWTADASTSTLVPQLDGVFTPRRALERLLKNTDLQAEFPDVHTAVISQAPSHTAVGRATTVRLANSTSDLSLADSTAGYDASEEVIVTAQKREERLQDVPVPLSVLNGDVLADSDQVLLRDYATSVPGFSVTPGIVGTQTLAIRGITTGGFTNSTVGVMIDDVPFGSSVAGFNEVPDIDPSDLARIEVLRGPQGTLYGASSMGGIVKFVTADPSTAGYSGRVEAGTSSVYNGAEPGFSIRGAANIPLSDTLAIRISGFRRQDPGYIDNPLINGLDGVNEAQSYGARASLRWKPSDTLSLKLSALYQHYNAGDTSESYVESGLGDLQHNSVPGSGAYDRTVQAYSANLNAKLGIVDLTSVTGFNVNRFSVSSDYSVYLGSEADKYFGVMGAPLVESSDFSKFSQELRLSMPLGRWFDWSLGAFFTHDNLPKDEYVPAEVPTTGEVVGRGYDSYFGSSYIEYAAFTDLTYHITDQFDVQIGGRESHDEQTSGGQEAVGPFIQDFYGADPYVFPRTIVKQNVFTYLLTPRFRISPDLMVYARLASGYRPGGSNGNPLPGVPADYTPDKTETYEIGVKGDFIDHALSVDASLYYVDWKDIQISLHNEQGLGYTGNGSRAKSEGAELSATYKPFRSLTAAAWVDYDDAVLTENFPLASTAYGMSGDRLPFSSEWSGNLSLEQTFPLVAEATGFGAVTASYVGNRVGLFSSSALRQIYPSYTKTDLRAGVKVDAWTASVYVNNVADKRGELSGGLGYYLPYSFTYIIPRTVGLNLTRTF
jgi:iron complex outermembrane recepter protein